MPPDIIGRIIGKVLAEPGQDDIKDLALMRLVSKAWQPALNGYAGMARLNAGRSRSWDIRDTEALIVNLLLCCQIYQIFFASKLCAVSQKWIWEPSKAVKS